MPSNRRSSTRHQVELPCTLRVAGDGGPAAELELANLSIGGALVRRPRLPLGTRVEVAFRIPTLEDSISTGAVVRWSTDVEVGLQFDGLRPRDVWALSKYFESLA